MAVPQEDVLMALKEELLSNVASALSDKKSEFEAKLAGLAEQCTLLASQDAKLQADYAVAMELEDLPPIQPGR